MRDTTPWILRSAITRLEVDPDDLLLRSDQWLQKHINNKITPSVWREAKQRVQAKRDEQTQQNLATLELVRLHNPVARTIVWGHHPGFVYLIQEPKGAYKIGRTKDIADRMRTFEVKLPYPIEIIHTIRCEDMYAAERFFHNLFASQRINGEWFSLSGDDVAHIQSFTDMKTVSVPEDFGY